jgi:tryptophan synthase alpha chain
MPFIPAGYPTLDATRAILPAIEQAGASLVEIGIPYSDPIADGPVIQEAFGHSLRAGLRVSHVMQAIAAVRPSISIPLVAMVSYSIVFRHGPPRFMDEAKQAGFDGLILPDLPPPEVDHVCALARSAGLDAVLLVSPTTSADRRRQIVSLCSGFVYYLSITGITGERGSLPADLAPNIRSLRQVTDLPICVGFGISQPKHLQELTGTADGAIVGSAIVRKLAQHARDRAEVIARVAADYCRELLGGILP